MNRLTTSGPIRVHYDTRGRAHIVADIPSRPFTGAFRVRKADASSVRVGFGTVHGRVPTLNGEPLHAKRLPKLKLDEGPNADLLSWICVRVTVDLESGLMDPDNADAATIVHVNDYSLIDVNGLAPDDGQGNGLCALATIVWRDAKTPRQIYQFMHFNPRHSFKAGSEGERGFHIFA